MIFIFYGFELKAEGLMEFELPRNKGTDGLLLHDQVRKRFQKDVFFAMLFYNAENQPFAQTGSGQT